MLTLPSRKQLALVVHDVQNDGVKPGGRFVEAFNKPADLTEYVRNNVQLLEGARRFGLPVFFTGHFLREDYLDAARRAPSPRIGALKAGTWGPEIIDELKPAPGEFLIRKGGGYSAFTGTAMDKWLRRLGVTTLIIAGGGAHVGLESTVRDAVDRDFDVVVASDACRDEPSHHQASMLNMTWFAEIATTAEVLLALEQAPS